MKKDLIFAPLMLLICVPLFLLNATGIAAHIVISAMGIAILAAYTAATKKGWKHPVLEILMRALYGIAFITGIVIMQIQEIATVAIVHKFSAASFVILLSALFLLKLRAKKV